MYQPSIDEIKKRLSQYSAIRVELGILEERLQRLKSEETLPPMRQGNGSKHTGGTGDRQERAIIRRMEYEERHGPEMAAKRNEMRYIEEAIKGVADPMERMVLRIRYTESETAKPTPWREVATAIYMDDSDSKMLATYRLLDKALKSLQELMLWEKEGEE
jgi:hypothetical protein